MTLLVAAPPGPGAVAGAVATGAFGVSTGVLLHAASVAAAISVNERVLNMGGSFVGVATAQTARLIP